MAALATASSSGRPYNKSHSLLLTGGGMNGPGLRPQESQCLRQLVPSTPVGPDSSKGRCLLLKSLCSTHTVMVSSSTSKVWAENPVRKWSKHRGRVSALSCMLQLTSPELICSQLPQARSAGAAGLAWADATQAAGRGACQPLAAGAACILQVRAQGRCFHLRGFLRTGNETQESWLPDPSLITAPLSRPSPWSRRELSLSKGIS